MPLYILGTTFLAHLMVKPRSACSPFSTNLVSPRAGITDSSVTMDAIAGEVVSAHGGIDYAA